MAQSYRRGVVLSVMDGFFAATALAKDLTLITPNIEDFASFGVPLLNRVGQIRHPSYGNPSCALLMFGCPTNRISDTSGTRHLSKSPKNLVSAEFGNLKIASTADRYRTSMAKSPPKSLRALYRRGRA